MKLFTVVFGFIIFGYTQRILVLVKSVNDVLSALCLLMIRFV